METPPLMNHEPLNVRNDNPIVVVQNCNKKDNSNFNDNNYEGKMK